MWGAERSVSISIFYTKQVPIQEVTYKKGGEGAANQYFDHQSHVNFNLWPQLCIKSQFIPTWWPWRAGGKAVLYWHVENYKMNLKCIHLNSWSQTSQTAKYSMWLIALYTPSDVNKVMFLFSFKRKLLPSQWFASPSTKFMNLNRN